jgi:hypothetical protein
MTWSIRAVGYVDEWRRPVDAAGYDLSGWADLIGRSLDGYESQAEAWQRAREMMRYPDIDGVVPVLVVVPDDEAMMPPRPVEDVLRWLEGTGPDPWKTS